MRMSQLAGAGVPPAAIFNRFSAGGVSLSQGVALSSMGMVSISSGSLTAGVLATALSVTGRGEINALAVQNAEAVARTMRLKVTIDGVVVFDATSNSTAVQYQGIVAVGQVPLSAGTVSLDKVIFNKSLLIEIASSDTSTNKLTVGIIYKTY